MQVKLPKITTKAKQKTKNKTSNKSFIEENNTKNKGLQNYQGSSGHSLQRGC